MTEQTQTVVDETKAPAEPGAEADNARNQGDDLETLLAQYDTEKGKVADSPPPNEAANPDVKALMAEVQSLKGQMQQVGQMQFKTDMADTVKAVRGDLDPEIFDDETVEAWIDGKARRDERLQKAWLQREQNPRAWQKVRAELGKQFASKFSKLPDKAATEDREAVAAAVRGASSTKALPETPPDFRGATNAEFRKEVRERYGFDPGV